jgi:hypothetical protein
MSHLHLHLESPKKHPLTHVPISAEAAAYPDRFHNLAHELNCLVKRGNVAGPLVEGRSYQRGLLMSLSLCLSLSVPIPLCLHQFCVCVL